jgi:uncharacterized protein (TIGR02466 family)
VDFDYKTKIIFPVPIHHFDVNVFDEIQDKLIDYAYKTKKKDPVGNIISNQGGWQSKSFNIGNESDPLHKILIDCIGNFSKHVVKGDVNFVVDAWINISKPKSYNRKHDHPTSDLSGVLWIKCPKECGDIVFESPVSYQTHAEVESYTEEFINSINYHHGFYFTPTEGVILIFPSHLNHFVQENRSNEDRISVSFNIRLTNYK